MPATRTTLPEFLTRRRRPDASEVLDALVIEIARSCVGIARLLAEGSWDAEEAGGRTLRVRGPYLTVFTPLAGPDLTAGGSVFSVLPTLASGVPGDHLPGSEQFCAGYALYGRTTTLVLTLGAGVVGFTLEPGSGDFVLTRPRIRVPDTTSEFAVDTATRRFWEPAVSRYVDECLAGTAGPRGRDFTLHWTDSVVSTAHRVLTGGGVHLCFPHPHLLFTANPIALLVEQAGGFASTGQQRVLDVPPTSPDQRTGLIFGARGEVRRIEAYHADQSRGVAPIHDIPFFSGRGLFRVRG